jgi:hypothetical protein
MTLQQVSIFALCASSLDGIGACFGESAQRAKLSFPKPLDEPTQRTPLNSVSLRRSPDSAELAQPPLVKNQSSGPRADGQR